jgi:protein required for attachment to host cells
MRKRPTTTWILVADGARGRFFRPNEELKKLVSVGPADMVAPQSRERPRDLKSDKPGRGYSSARGGVRHAFEPPHDYHKLEKHRFMAVLAEALDDACERREFDDLIVVAPHRSLGELRGLLSKRVQQRIRQEVAKDLTNEPASRLWRRLAPVIRPIV